MATAPTSIQVLVVPADGTNLRYETFGTVREEIKPPTFPSDDPNIPLYERGHVDAYWREYEAMIAKHHTVARRKSFPQPKYSLLPEVKGHRPAEAWEERAVIGCHRWHIFFTTHATSDLKTNPHVGHCVSGDVFVLWLSNTQDANGRRFYVDLKPDSFNQDTLRSSFPGIVSDLKQMKGEVNVR